VAQASGSGVLGQSPDLRAPTEPLAPIDGSVVRVAVAVGEHVDKGALLVTLEAMKMELPVLAPRAGVVEAVMVEAGDVVTRGGHLVKLSGAASIDER
jgi:biotin carboxyl carrier protein